MEKQELDGMMEISEAWVWFKHCAQYVCDERLDLTQ